VAARLPAPTDPLGTQSRHPRSVPQTRLLPDHSPTTQLIVLAVVRLQQKSTPSTKSCRQQRKKNPQHRCPRSAGPLMLRRPAFLGQGICGVSMLRLQLVIFGMNFCGGSVAECGVEASVIVEHLDVSDDRPVSMCTCRERSSVHELVLQGAEEGFGHSVVPADPGAAD
jgi:hypothetical protein